MSFGLIKGEIEDECGMLKDNEHAKYYFNLFKKNDDAYVIVRSSKRSLPPKKLKKLSSGSA